ncbi:Haloacid dehalogenase-like hydrolase [seawater metagenome]|uniref:Haloacid dehalogenase-like hydrolase n=1 Tax=seawater metagenome TaxID=1561972 RepID=A0A5E8CI57_9ZZZZ
MNFTHFNLNSIDNNVFFLFDLDGTLIDSEYIQWKSYNEALKEYIIDLSFANFIRICHNGNIKSYLINECGFGLENYNLLKNKKNLLMQENCIKDLKLIKGVKELLEYINLNSINCAVVTNGAEFSVNLYKSLIPELNYIKNWIKREDYLNPKPSSECYKLAIKKFYKNEKSIIGFENSYSGYVALKNVTDNIYFITDTQYIYLDKIKNVKLIRDFNQY